ncbi:hypothetical protein TSUD_180750 [Trifolium subterraneum]|uniref:Uncharacterized protein n=1 Tax=Trifolium subterraneum TaxID=3900 RepID=A0A2Z6PB09_TRISU|nr:hypothetical protein TSUD_180750 [Trifolium subterraneum]
MLTATIITGSQIINLIIGDTFHRPVSQIQQRSFSVERLRASRPYEFRELRPGVDEFVVQRPLYMEDRRSLGVSQRIGFEGRFQNLMGEKTGPVSSSRHANAVGFAWRIKGGYRPR